MDFTILTEKSQVRTRLTKISFLEYANANKKDGYFNDVTITIDDLDIPANRMVLSYCCLFFEKMFKAGLKESRENVVKLQGVEATAIETIVEYFYTATIDINDQNVIEILEAADYLQLEELKGFCSEFLLSLNTAGTSVMNLTLAKLYRLESLEEAAYQSISNDFELVSDQCCLLSKDDFASCISKLDRIKSHETSIYQAIVKWVKHSEERKQDFAELLPLVNLNNLPLEFLTDVVSAEELVVGNLTCCNLVMNHTVQLFKKENIKRKKATKLISFGGSNTPKKVLNVYNSLNEPLMNYPNLVEKPSCVIGDQLNHCVYLIRGPSNSDSKDTWSGASSFNEESVTWKEVPWPIGNGQAAIYDDKLVAVDCYYDHCNRSKVISQLLCYFPELCCWVKGPDMQPIRGGFELVTCSGKLFVVGGADDSSGTILSSVQQLTIQENMFAMRQHYCHKDCLNREESTKLHMNLCENCLIKLLRSMSSTYQSSSTYERPHEEILKIVSLGQWVTKQPMQLPRRAFAAVNCNDRIYAIGGQCNTGNFILTNTVEEYDPTTDVWTYVSEMTHARSEHAACVLDDKIYVVGGMGNDNKAVNDIECYDPSCDEWTVVGTTVDSLRGHSLIAV